MDLCSLGKKKFMSKKIEVIGMNRPLWFLLLFFFFLLFFFLFFFWFPVFDVFGKFFKED